MPTVNVARALLGHYLVWRHPQSQYLHRFKIVETEAYTQDDPACHAHGKTTGRAALFYGPPAVAYVYFTYGMHHCLNVITEPEGTAGAVLFRALEPLEAEDRKNHLPTHGPGRLCKTLGLTKAEHNGMSFIDPDAAMFLAYGDTLPTTEEIVAAPRIGISKAQEYPWRFYVSGSPWLSTVSKIKLPE